MNIETALRRHLREATDDQKVAVWVNNEGRMMLTITNADRSQTEFVAVEDKLIPWPVKPPTQRAAVQGFDSHKGMGVR